MKRVFCNLREVMKNKGYNIKLLNEKSNLSRTTISNLLNHISTGIQYDTLAQLCEILECDPNDLLKIHDLDLKFEVTNIQYMEIENEKDPSPFMESAHVEFYVKSFLLIDNNEIILFYPVEAEFLHDDNKYFDLTDYSASKKLEHQLSKSQLPIYIKDTYKKELKKIIESVIKSYLKNNK